MTFVEPDARPDGFLGELVERALALPTGNPAALARVVELCDANQSAQAVALEAGRDEAFAALLLRAANSAAYFSTARVADLRSAVTRLGLRHVQALAFGAPGLQMLAAGPEDLRWARNEIHRHAVRVGLVARSLSATEADGDRALAAGLLHNLGLMAIAAHAPDELRYLLTARQRGEQFWQAEDWIFGFSHAELGAILASRWSYPLDLVVAIRDHDAPEPGSALAAVVQRADLLVRSFGIGIEPPRPLEGEEAAVEARVAELLAAQDRFEASAAA